MYVYVGIPMARFQDECVRILENRRTVVVLAAAISLAVLLFTEFCDHWGDIDHYYKNAGDVLDGLMPYSEAPFEYPPLSLVFMLIPRILSWDLSSFHFACAILTYVFLVIGGYFLYRIADEYIGKRWQTGMIILFLLGFGSYFVIARNDVYPAVLSIIGLWLYLKKSYVPAFVVISLAALTKLYPAIFLIPMLIPFVMNRDWKNLAVSVLAVAAVGVLVELPFILADPSTAFAYLSYHSDRGIQVESIASGFFMIYYLLVPSDITVVFNYGSDNLSGVGPDTLAPWMNSIMAAVMLLFIVVMVLRIRRSSAARSNILPLMSLLCLAFLMLFITFSKVYSAQYYIWIMLMVPFTQFACFGEGHKREIIKLMVPFGIFTVLSYTAYLNLGLPSLNAVPILMVVLKNVFHILLTWAVVHMCWYETRPDGCDHGDRAFSRIPFLNVGSSEE